MTEPTTEAVTPLAVQLINLRAAYGKTEVLHGVDLSVGIGERIAMEIVMARDAGTLENVLT